MRLLIPVLATESNVGSARRVFQRASGYHHRLAETDVLPLLPTKGEGGGEEGQFRPTPEKLRRLRQNPSSTIPPLLRASDGIDPLSGTRLVGEQSDLSPCRWKNVCRVHGILLSNPPRDAQMESGRRHMATGPPGRQAVKAAAVDVRAVVRRSVPSAVATTGQTARGILALRSARQKPVQHRILTAI